MAKSDKDKITAPDDSIVYGDRDELDAELSGAIADILSAEEEAKRIIARAEETVKAIQLDLATRERDMREVSGKVSAEAREQKLKDARVLAEQQRAKRVAAAQEEGEKIIKSKDKAIAARIKELYAMIGGKA